MGSDILAQPDLLVVDLAEARTLDWRRINLSPTSLRADRFTKRRLYQERRIPAYWVVDPDARRVEVWTPDATFPAVERERGVWHPTGAAAPLVIEVAEVFRPVYVLDLHEGTRAR